MIQQSKQLSTKEGSTKEGSTKGGSTKSRRSSEQGRFALSQEPVIPTSAKEEALPETLHEASHPGADEHLGELTPGYGSRNVFLTARDPHCLYAYWDWDWSEFPLLRQPQAEPRMRVLDEAGEVVREISLNREARNWYVDVPEANTHYIVEIGVAPQPGRWEPVTSPVGARTPNDRFGEEKGFSIASVPFHLHFDELLATLREAVEEGESLTRALGRLQAIGLPIDAEGNVLTELTPEQRALLELLLGRDVWERMQAGSLDLASLFRAELAETLSSGAASESLLKVRLASLIGGESSLFSGLIGSWFSGGAESREWTAGPMSSEMLASWRAAIGETSWQFAITSASWAAALGFTSGGFAAASEQFAWLGGSERWLGGSEIFGGSSEKLAGASEIMAGLGSSEQLSSYRAKLTSWFAAPALTPESSWFQAGPGMSELFSSWQMGVTGASGGLSSGALASWSHGRAFFMHVNAEVIFYGGTDPQAKVWIDGAPIALDASGNFRYHFKFPDADFEIPIVAESPDGQETRSATLYFRRNTQREGKVDATEQPAELSDPIGRVS